MAPQSKRKDYEATLSLCAIAVPSADNLAPVAQLARSNAPASAKLLEALASKAPEFIVPLWIGALADDPSKAAATLEALCANAEIKDAALLAALTPKMVKVVCE